MQILITKRQNFELQNFFEREKKYFTYTYYHTKSLLYCRLKQYRLFPSVNPSALDSPTLLTQISTLLLLFSSSNRLSHHASPLSPPFGPQQRSESLCGFSRSELLRPRCRKTGSGTALRTCGQNGIKGKVLVGANGGRMSAFFLQ